MICPACHGTGWIIEMRRSEPSGFRLISAEMPCPECGGAGIVSCCDTAGAGIADGGSAEKLGEKSE